MAERARFSIALIFIGPNGLRAGWRFLLFALAIEIGAFVIEELVAAVLDRGNGAATQRRVYRESGQPTDVIAHAVKATMS